MAINIQKYRYLNTCHFMQCKNSKTRGKHAVNLSPEPVLSHCILRPKPFEVNWSHTVFGYIQVQRLHKLYRLRKKSPFLVHWGNELGALYFRRLHQLKHTIILRNVNIYRIFLTIGFFWFLVKKFSTISTFGQTNCNLFGNCPMSDRYFKSCSI